MKFLKMQVACCLLMAGGIAGGAVFASSRHAPLAVGWHNEMNDISGWQPLSGINAPDVLVRHPGAMTLRMPHVPDGFPYEYQWGGVTRRASVDLGRYPVIVASVGRLEKGSYAHMEVEERDINGKHVRTLRTPTLQSGGLSILDVGQALKQEDTRRLYLKLIVGGPLTGASCDYAWVRFVRRGDVPKLQAEGSGQKIELKP